MARLTLKKVNEAITAKWPGVEVVRGRGEGYQYYYVSAIDFDSDIALKIAGLYQTTISGVTTLNELTIAKWIESVEWVLLDKYLYNTHDRCPVI